MERLCGRLNTRFDLLLCTAHGGIDWDTLLMILKKNGRLVLVAFPQVALDSIDLVAHQISTTGSFMGNRAAMREMLAFAHMSTALPPGRVDADVAGERGDSAPERNKARYRIVLVNDPDETRPATERPA